MTLNDKHAITEHDGVPVFDFQVLHASTGDERKTILHRLDEAFTDHGLIFVLNHSVGADFVDEAFSWARISAPVRQKFSLIHI